MAPHRSYPRVLVKISGETFGGSLALELDHVRRIAREIATAEKEKVQLGIVVGGGNIIRGASLSQHGFDRATGDYMGMMATVINAMALQESLAKEGTRSSVITARTIEGIGELYHHQKCLRYLEEGKVLIFAGGTGHPYFTTDTAAALTAVEIGAQCMFKATKVDGVYDKDPIKNPDASKFDFLTYDEVLFKEYRVMDLTAISFCKENDLSIRVFNLLQPGNLLRAMKKENIGTLIANHNSKSPL